MAGFTGISGASSHVLDLLYGSAACEGTGITFYNNNVQEEPEYVTYAAVLEEARCKAKTLELELEHQHYCQTSTSKSIVLVHFNTHRDNVVWFWACLIAGYVPAMSTPFTNDKDGRASHLRHLHSLLLDPLVITTKELLQDDFSENTLLRVLAVNDNDNTREHSLVPSPTQSVSDNQYYASSNTSLDEVDALELSSQKDSLSPIEASGNILGNDVPVSLIDDHHQPDPVVTSPDSSALPEVISVEEEVLEQSIDHTQDCIPFQDNISSLSSHEITSSAEKAPEPLLPLQHDSLTDPFTSLTGVAVLMLTSGSTGNAKAVAISHEQILAACAGKIYHMPMQRGSTILNWIALDHVGSLVELHLTAMAGGCSQVLVPAREMIADPLQFLRLLSQHQVVRTFAPNFFLQNLQQRLDVAELRDISGIHLNHLLYIISGGEANSVANCVQLSQHLIKLGAPTSVTIHPGFGMTETCAGSIYSQQCPHIDVIAGTEFAALGTCIPGIQMRISPTSPGSTEGALEVSGKLVFSRYFNNAEATKEAFTEDGWFRTGDLGTIDDQGVLRLCGRSKDLININGVKYLPHEIEDAIERKGIQGVAKSQVVCFAVRAPGAKTEQVCVVYQQEFEPSDSTARLQALQDIIQTVVLFSGARPRVLPLPEGRLQRTTLGKFSRNKIRSSLLSGDFKEDEDFDAEMLRTARTGAGSECRNNTERELTQILRDTGVTVMDLGIDTPILNTGITSVDLIQIKRSAEKVFGIKDIPIITIMTNTTVRTLGSAIDAILAKQQSSSVSPESHPVYDPVVVLQPNGTKTPLWLIHPGIGEMLVFLGLVKYFPDRPIYAMRARGLNRGEEPFSGLPEILETYHSAIKSYQPQGPYAIAGYSYGSMIAFEIAKILESQNDVVKFLGSFNLPPHIKTRMRRLDWTAGMVHIAHFCTIISEQRSAELAHELRSLPHEEQVATLLKESDPVRCAELALDHASLLNWTDVSWSLQQIGWEYDPSGTVAHLDIFYCSPLKDVAKDRVEYRRDHLNHWVGFIRDDLKFWEVDGEHYTMIGPDHVPKFQQTLKTALAARGL